jgi:hypothetical protein
MICVNLRNLRSYYFGYNFLFSALRHFHRYSLKGLPARFIG